MSEAPIIKAFKELEEAKAFKDWGTQTEKEDASASNSYFCIPELGFTDFLWVFFDFVTLSIKSPSGLNDGIKSYNVQTSGIFLKKIKMIQLNDLFKIEGMQRLLLGLRLQSS